MCIVSQWLIRNDYWGFFVRSKSLTMLLSAMLPNIEFSLCIAYREENWLVPGCPD